MKIKKKTKKKTDKIKIIAFKMYNVFFDEAIDYYIEFSCRCNIEYACLLHFEQQKKLRIYYQTCDFVRIFEENSKCVCFNERRCILH